MRWRFCWCCWHGARTTDFPCNDTIFLARDPCAGDESMLNMDTEFQYIRPSVLLNATGNDRTSFVRLLEIFLRTCPAMFNSLEDAARHENLETVGRQAHCLKTCLSVIGAIEAIDELERVEEGAVRNQVLYDSATIVRLRTAVEAILEEASRCLALQPSGEPA